MTEPEFEWSWSTSSKCNGGEADWSDNGDGKNYDATCKDEMAQGYRNQAVAHGCQARTTLAQSPA